MAMIDILYIQSDISALCVDALAHVPADKMIAGIPVSREDALRVLGVISEKCGKNYDLSNVAVVLDVRRD